MPCLIVSDQRPSDCVLASATIGAVEIEAHGRIRLGRASGDEPAGGVGFDRLDGDAGRGGRRRRRQGPHRKGGRRRRAAATALAGAAAAATFGAARERRRRPHWMSPAPPCPRPRPAKDCGRRARSVGGMMTNWPEASAVASATVLPASRNSTFAFGAARPAMTASPVGSTLTTSKAGLTPGGGAFAVALARAGLTPGGAAAAYRRPAPRPVTPGAAGGTLGAARSGARASTCVAAGARPQEARMGPDQRACARAGDHDRRRRGSRPKSASLRQACSLAFARAYTPKRSVATNACHA